MSQPHSATAATDPIERAKTLFTAWEDFFHGRDIDGLLGLYHQDALLESPIIPRLLDQKDGAVHGHRGIRTFYAAIFAEISDLSDHPEIKYLTDGTTLTWAYTRKVPGGETLDMAEVWDIDEQGLIRRHRVFWGWRGLRLAASGDHSFRAGGSADATS